MTRLLSALRFTAELIALGFGMAGLVVGIFALHEVMKP